MAYCSNACWIMKLKIIFIYSVISFRIGWTAEGTDRQEASQRDIYVRAGSLANMLGSLANKD